VNGLSGRLEGELGRWRHDLKDQLGIILGFSDLLQELDPADARHADLQEIQTAARHAMTLLGELPGAVKENQT
jgi:hypothetical protein